MAQISRRVLLLLLGALLPGAINQSSQAASSKKPSPTPTPKKPSPTPSKKKTTRPKSSSSPKVSSSPQASQSKTAEGIVIAKSADLVFRQTKVFYLKDSFGISSGYSLTRTSRGVVAFNVRCTHNGVPSDLVSNQLKCPAHGSIFDPETGMVVRGPAVEPLKSYRTIEENGEIRIIIS